MLVIGIGNPYRKDDGVGAYVATQVKGQVASGEFSSLMELWRGHDKVVIIDALHSFYSPGERVTFFAHEKELPKDYNQTSTHGMGLREAVELARALGELPRELIIHAIEGEDFSEGQGLSCPVKKSADELIKLLRETCHA